MTTGKAIAMNGITGFRRRMRHASRDTSMCSEAGQSPQDFDQLSVGEKVGFLKDLFREVLPLAIERAADDRGRASLATRFPDLMNRIDQAREIAESAPRQRS